MYCNKLSKKKKKNCKKINLVKKKYVRNSYVNDLSLFFIKMCHFFYILNNSLEVLYWIIGQL